jgi:hypothetical protein
MSTTSLARPAALPPPTNGSEGFDARSSPKSLGRCRNDRNGYFDFADIVVLPVRFGRATGEVAVVR